MEAVQVTPKEQQVLDAMRASPKLQGAIVALVEVAHNGELSTRSARAMEKAAAALPALDPAFRRVVVVMNATAEEVAMNVRREAAGRMERGMRTTPEGPGTCRKGNQGG